MILFKRLKLDGDKKTLPGKESLVVKANWTQKKKKINYLLHCFII